MEFKELLSLATKESFFIFIGKLFKQVDGVTMGSAFGLKLANAFSCIIQRKLVTKLSIRI